VLLRALVDTSIAVARTRSRNQKRDALAALLRELAPEEIGPGLGYLTGSLPQGKIGLGYAAVRDARDVAAAPGATLSITDAHQTFTAIGESSGSGSAGRKKHLFGGLMARATGEEQDFLARLVLGELRQGASEGVMADALAAAADLPADAVRRAAMLAGDLGAVGCAALIEGRAGLDQFRLTLFRPLQPMLAQPAESFDDVFDRIDEPAFEIKLDGARVQVHKQDDEVRVYSRRLNDVTTAVPEVVECVRALPARQLILDGEAIALRDDGRPHPFQVTMRRFGRRIDVAAQRARLPLSVLFFDTLQIDEDELLDQPAHERLARLDALVPEQHRVPRIVTAARDRASDFWRQALDQGHEGLMAKALDASYAAGGRGYSWLKLKPNHTLDLVVLAAEWGSGRRKGWLSNLHLGARDPGSASGWAMLGKTFKGMTDKLLAWQTEQILARETERDGHVVHCRPELVVEIAFSDVQQSPHYESGFALRFARVKGYRDDKAAADANTLADVRSIYDASVA